MFSQCGLQFNFNKALVTSCSRALVVAKFSFSAALPQSSPYFCRFLLVMNCTHFFGNHVIGAKYPPTFIDD
jgi:hypothetical protein